MKHWQDSAKCQGMDPRIFFPEKGQTADLARVICAACEVRTPCLEDALSHHERFGIWGGTTERQRRGRSWHSFSH